MAETRQAQPLDVPATDSLRYLPEGPYPLGEGRFSWVGIQHGPDATHGSVNRYDLTSGQNESFDLPGRPGFAFPCRTPDSFVVGCERTLGIFDLISGHWEPFCGGIDGDVANTIINDGMVYRDNLIFGTKDLEFANRKAGLYLYRMSDKRLTRLRSDQICSNGKAMLSGSDGLQLIDIDSPTRKVVRYPIDIDRNEIGSAETLLDFSGDAAVPDGAILTPDQTGLIVAMFRPEAAPHGETRWYDLQSGELRCTWQTEGSPQNTCPALVAHQGKVWLIITTAVEHLTEADRKGCPNAGRIFIGETDFDTPGDAPVYPV